MRRPWRAFTALAALAGLGACDKPPLAANWQYITALDATPDRYVAPRPEGAPPRAAVIQDEAGRDAGLFITLANIGKKPLVLSAIHLNERVQPPARWINVRLDPGRPQVLAIAADGAWPRCLVPQRLYLTADNGKQSVIAITGQLSASMLRAYRQQGCVITPSL